MISIEIESETDPYYVDNIYGKQPDPRGGVEIE
jgi:hypothetical protein